MKVIVHATYSVTESFEINVDIESYDMDLVRDEAWEAAYSKTGNLDLQYVDWEVIEGLDE